MLMFLILLVSSLIVGLVSVLIMKGVAPDEPAPAPEVRPQPELLVPASQFFTIDPPVVAPQPPLPIGVLLHNIERHVRLEQAAIETFLEVPTARTLHSRTPSPFVN